MKALLYARVSTKEQRDKGTSLDSQLEAMRSWASENGYEVAYEFTEDWTGTTLDRPKLNEAKRLAQVREVEGFLVYSWDRLARNTTHQHVLRYLIEEQWGVNLICITQPEMDELAAMIYEATIAIASEIENYMRRERTARGIREAAITRGQLPSGGQNLFGYDYAPKSKGGDGKRTVNEEEARVVQLIFQWFVQDRLSIHGIAKRLEEMAVLTKKGKKKWRYSTLDRLLRNPVYAGRCYAYRWETVEPRKPRKSTRRSKRSSTRLRPQEEWIELSESPTPPIISEELWQAAQARLKAGRKVRREPKYPYLLRGQVECACGKSMVACSISAKYRYYRCSAKVGVDVGHRLLIPAQQLEETVWFCIKDLFSDPRRALYGLEKGERGEETPLQERIADIERVLEDLELAERRAVSLYSLGKIDQRKIQDEVERIQTEREGWERELDKLRARFESKAVLLAHKDEIIEAIEGFAQELEGASFERKREILEMLRVRVYIERADEEREKVWADSFKAPMMLITKEGGRVVTVLLDVAGVCAIFPTSRSWGNYAKTIPFEFKSRIG